MRESRFTEKQIVGILQEHGGSLLDLCGLSGSAGPGVTLHVELPVGASGAETSVIGAADAPGRLGPCRGLG